MKNHTVYFCVYILLVNGLLFLAPANAAVYQLTEPYIGKRSTHSYFNNKGIDRVFLATECKKNKKCIKNIVSRNKVLFRNVSSEKKSVSLIAEGRFAKHSFALFKETRDKTRYFIVDNKGRKSPFRYAVPDALASLINDKGQLVYVTKNGIYINNKKVQAAPAKLIRANLRNSSDGLLTVTAVTDNNEVWVGNLKKWLPTGIVLETHGDIDNVTSSYPASDNLHYGVVYQYVNSYNKGLRVFRVDFETNDAKQAWLYNSDKTNIGFSPDVFLNSNKLTIGTYNSSQEKAVYFSVDKNLVQNMTDIIPEHIRGFESESLLAFTLGSGVALKFWDASSSVDSGGTTLMDVDYDISSAIYTSALFQGRFDNTQLGISYLKNEAEKSDGLVADASEYLSMYFDFNGLLEASRTLRLRFERATINGVASVTGTTPQKTEFVTDFSHYSVLVMAERGRYSGVEISQYRLPGAIGFSSASGTTNAYYDPRLGITRLGYLIGYDELAYSKRYETNASRSYFSFSGGIGIGQFDISSEIKARVELDFGQKIGSAIFAEVTASLEYGYIYQKRLRSLSGFGGVFQAGYQAHLSNMSSTRSDESDTTELALEFDRQDLLHGPFVRASLIF